MRFHPQGPDIPSKLLQARDEGKVVFLCGAGVSKAKANLPDFRELAGKVIADLGIGSESKAKRLLDATDQPLHNDSDFGPQLDQVFDQLEIEVERELIHEKIALELRTSSSTDHSCHATLLRLSRGNTNQPQLITTNFDRLFEQADPSIQFHTPPSFPPLRNFEDLEGLVYLHGRLTTEQARSTQNIIVSGSDFGRAYLAEMWATRFLIEVLQHHTLVLVGYTANDPVMRYLLQGLRTSTQHKLNDIYAFTEASDPEQIVKFEDKGIITLPFSDHSFLALWQTLDLWADLADAPQAWIARTLKLAEQDPYSLQPFERGQVMELITTKDGAAAFSVANPPASWITILDGSIRQFAGGETDSDPPKSDANSNQPTLRNFLSWESPERNLVAISNGRDEFPPPLLSLSGWIGNQLADPLIIWWLARQHSISPPLLRHIKIQIESLDLNENTEVLSLLVEKWERNDDSFFAYEWMNFSKCVGKHGWMPSSPSQFNRTAYPALAIQAGNIFKTLEAHLKTLKGHKVKPSEYLSIEVKFPSLKSEIQIPQEALFEALTILSSHLQTATRYLGWIGRPNFFNESLLEPPNSDSSHIRCKQSAYLRFILRIFTQLQKENIQQARTITRSWDHTDEHLQGRLCLFSLRFPNLLPAEEASKILCKLPDSIFWDTSHRPEKLHSLKACWPSLTTDQKTQIEKRILIGPPKYEDDDSKYQQRVARYSMIELGWLKQQGVDLTSETVRLLPSLKKIDSFWKDEWIESADQIISRTRSGFITKDENHTSLLGVDVAQIIETATDLTGARSGFEEKDPFRGLVKDDPQKAFSALVHSSKNNEWPVDFWRRLLNSYPENTPHNLAFEISQVILDSPNDFWGDIARSWADWLREQIKNMYAHDTNKTLELWDNTIGRFQELPEDCFSSGLGESWVGGKKQSFSRRTYDHAINSSAGRIMECLHILIDTARPSNERRLPEFAKDTISKLLKLPPMAADYVATEITIRLNFYFWADQKWTSQTILPFFDRKSSLHEAAWNGFFHQGQIPSTELFSLLKVRFFDFIKEYADLQWDDRTKAQIASFLVCSLAVDQEVFTNSEGRSILKKMDDNARIEAIRWIADQLEKEPMFWDKFVRNFFQDVWPMQRQYQTEGTSSALASLIANTGTFFSEAAEQLKYLLVPTDDLLCLTHRFGEKDMAFKNTEALSHPSVFLDLLNRTVSDKGPDHTYGLSSALEKLAELEPDLRHSPQWKRLKKLS